MNRAMENSEGAFDCELCGRTLSSKGPLKIHLETQHGSGSRPHPCYICGKLSKNRDALRCHLRRYHKDSN